MLLPLAAASLVDSLVRVQVESEGPMEFDAQAQLAFDPAGYDDLHPLCSRYKDLPKTWAGPVEPPALGATLVVRRGAPLKAALAGRGTAELVLLGEDIVVATAEASGAFAIDIPPDAPVGFYQLRIAGVAAGGCTDTDGALRDQDGDGCAEYVGNKNWCGGYDPAPTPGAATFASMAMCCECGGGERGATQAAGAQALDLAVLFNPFTCDTCPEKAYRSLERDFVEEYVGGDEGLIWQGLSDSYEAHSWSFEPFRAANLLVSLSLLDGLSADARRDPALVTRHLSFVIGSQVCYGKWGDGDYTRGKPAGGYRCATPNAIGRDPRELYESCHDPGHWTGTSPILEQFYALKVQGKPSQVQYCQCFVFAGVFTTVGRSLGLAARPVTNFQSAHDSTGDRAIAKFFFTDTTDADVWDPADGLVECPDMCDDAASAHAAGCDLKACADVVGTGVGFASKPECLPCLPCVPCGNEDDSVWSFHVWTEIFFRRADERNANGWQALDATPQEESEGRYQMGPAPVKHVKKGDDSCFDTDFVVSEVNADVKLFVYEAEGSTQAARKQAVAAGRFQMHEGDPLYWGTRWQNDPFEDRFNTIGFMAATKAVGAISAACRADGAQCDGELDDVTGDYKKCARETQGGAACGAGPSTGAPVPGSCRAGGLIELAETTLPKKRIRKASSSDDPSDGPRPEKRLRKGALAGGLPMDGYLADRHEVGTVRARPRGFAANILKQARDVGHGASGRSETFSLNRAAQQDLALVGDLVAPGPVRVGLVPLRVELASLADVARDVVVRIHVTAMHYDGRPVVYLKTRHETHLAKVPLEGEQTVLVRRLTVPPRASAALEHSLVLSAAQLEGRRIQVTGKGFLEFHLSVYCAATGQRILKAPRRRLAA